LIKGLLATPELASDPYLKGDNMAKRIFYFFLCIVISGFHFCQVNAQESPVDTLGLYSELAGDYEYYFNDRYSRLTVYTHDGILMVDERGYPHLVMEPVDLGNLEFEAADDRRLYSFRFQRKEGMISNCVWNRGDESLDAVRYKGGYVPVRLTKEELRADFRQMQSLIEKTHPILYEFTNKEIFDKIFNKHYALISDDMSLEEFFRIAVPL